MSDNSYPEDPTPNQAEPRAASPSVQQVRRTAEPLLKYRPGQFVQEIVYAAWLVSWVLIAPGGFPRHWRFLTFERCLEGIGFALLLAPIAAVMGLFVAVPLFAVVVQVICTILNILGYRPQPKRLDSGPLVTVILCISLSGAFVCIVLLTLLKLSSPDGSGSPLKLSQAWEQTLTEIVGSIMLVTIFCMVRIFLNQRPAEEADDGP